MSEDEETKVKDILNQIGKWEALRYTIENLMKGTSDLNPDVFGADKYDFSFTFMDDPMKEYPTVKLVRNEPDFLVENIKAYNSDIGDFVYYQGFRGPIKIWKVDYPENIITKEEILRNYGEWGELDNLNFVKR